MNYSKKNKNINISLIVLGTIIGILGIVYIISISKYREIMKIPTDIGCLSVDMYFDSLCTYGDNSVISESDWKRYRNKKFNYYRIGALALVSAIILLLVIFILLGVKFYFKKKAKSN